ncbi:MAG: helix-turn-helix domain-containing protein [Arenibacter sp.]
MTCFTGPYCIWVDKNKGWASKKNNSNPDLSISIIAEQCGFGTIANFNRKFKEIEGVTPTEYRRQR